MANYEEWLEGAQQYGAPLEDRSEVPVVGEDGIDNTASIPGVRYSGNPLTDSRAQPTGFIQLHLASLFSKISAMLQTVTSAISDMTTLKTDTAAVRDAANAATVATQNATTAAQTATAGAEKVNAQLSGLTVTITDRNGQSQSLDFSALKPVLVPDDDPGSLLEDDSQGDGDG